ncbi:sarcalumenin-like protein [Pitangus sulphuratus]|nr:sarcalumenin-like protein [Pitangus sulphuratus]
MGGIFGKSKRCCGFSRVVYKAKGKRTPRMSCDASTWTGENHFHSARIGRTPKGPEPPAAKLVVEICESEDEQEAAAPPRARHTEASLSVTAEVSQEPEAKPPTEVVQHQEPPEQAKQAQPGQILQESSGPGDALCPAGSCEDHEAPSQITVEVDVHVSAEGQGGPDKVQSAPAESELLPGTGQEAGSASEDAGVGKAPWEVPVQDSGLALKAAETREGTTTGHGCAEGAEAPPDLQLGQDTEVPLTEGVEAKASEAEQAGEMADLCDYRGAGISPTTRPDFYDVESF